MRGRLGNCCSYVCANVQSHDSFTHFITDFITHFITHFFSHLLTHLYSHFFSHLYTHFFSFYLRLPFIHLQV